MRNNDCLSEGLAARAGATAAAPRWLGTGPGHGDTPRRKSGHSAALAGKVDAIRALEVFRECRDSELERLAEASTLRRLRRGATLTAGYDDEKLVAVVRGHVRTTTNREGVHGELILDVLGSGAVVCDWCWTVTDDSDVGAIVAVEDSVLLVTPQRALEALLITDGEASIRFLELLAMARARALALATQNASLSVGDRLYCRLVELATLRAVETPDGLLVAHGLSQCELAAFTSASRENVNRQLNEWRSRGWIDLGRRSFLVRDSKALGRAVSPAADRVGFWQGDGRLAFPDTTSPPDSRKR